MEHKGIIVGITGQSGAGKTAVSAMLAARGYPVIDADLVARQVVAKGSKCTLDLAVEFGIEILNVDGTLNRRKLGSIVFTDKKKRMRLNRITFPYIQEEIFLQVEGLRKKGKNVIFLDAPTLIESGTHKRCDKVVSVIAPLELRVRRIIQRDELTREEAMQRISAQHGDAYYTSRSDFVIENSGDIDGLREKVAQLIDRCCPDQQKEE